MNIRNNNFNSNLNLPKIEIEEDEEEIEVKPRGSFLVKFLKFSAITIASSYICK